MTHPVFGPASRTRQALFDIERACATTLLLLSTPFSLSNDLAIPVTGHDLDPISLNIDMVADPVMSFGPPFTHA